MKKITSTQIAEQSFRNWLVVRNAYAKAKEAEGLRTINEIDGRKEYVALHNALLAVSNAAHPEQSDSRSTLPRWE